MDKTGNNFYRNTKTAFLFLSISVKYRNIKSKAFNGYCFVSKRSEDSFALAC